MKWLLVAVALGLAAGPAEAQLRRASAQHGNGGPPPPAPYQDRTIDGLAPLPEEEDSQPLYNREGWPRFLRLETRLGTEPGEGSKLRAGLVGAIGIETPNHGVLSADAAIAPSEGSSAVTLRQRGLPVSGGWMVNNEIGVTNPVASDIMRLPSRVFVPAVTTRGASTEWRGLGGTAFAASSGEFGRLQGYPVPGFLPLSGTVSFLGAQGIVDGWFVAARHAYAHGVTQSEDPAPGAVPVNSHATYLAARTETAGHVLQANLIGTRSNETSGGRYGIWIDGESRRGSAAYGWGVFRLDTQLSWAGQAMASDIEGAYVRGSWHTRRWSAQASADLLRSISGPDDTGVLVTTNGQWRYSRKLSFGAGGTMRRYLGNAGSGFLDARWEHDWGRTGVRGESSSFSGERSRRMIVDHDWLVPSGWLLSTSLSVGRESGSERAGSIRGAALSLSAPLSSSATLLANATTERRGNGDRHDSANVSLLWQVARNWSIEGNLLYTRGQQRLTAPIDPLAPLPERFLERTNDHAIFLVLRYENRAGSRSAPLGGPPQGGGGRVSGVVFLDANRNGTQEASERGAAGVTVHLDGRFATRTDAQGRFEFAFVAPGARVVTVLNETLPLPWEVPRDAERRLEVQVRESIEVRIPVVRPD